MDIQSAVTAGQMVGNLSVAGLLGVIVIVLGYLLIKTYNNGITETGKKIDTVIEVNKKTLDSSRELATTAKLTLDASKEHTNTLVKLVESNNKQVVDKLADIDQRVDAIKYSRFTGTGIKVEN